MRILRSWPRQQLHSHHSGIERRRERAGRCEQSSAAAAYPFLPVVSLLSFPASIARSLAREDAVGPGMSSEVFRRDGHL